VNRVALNEQRMRRRNRLLIRLLWLLYQRLAPVAEYMVASPASEAYVQRIFSVAGILSSGRRNRMRKSLEMCAFLKLNDKLIDC